MNHILNLVVFVTILSMVLARISPALKTTLSHGGVLVGRHMTTLSGKNIRAYLGVPYALPPIGENRFKAPLPFGSWKGERMAVQDSSPCIQINPFTTAAQEPTGSEDCLYLNVYVPAESKTKGPLPVMFYIFGGGFINGQASSTLYGPQYLLERDIILVTANYRLGPMGFLSTETVDVPGNFGLKDQVLALQWIQQNIATFGGNPKSVTIFGWSSGAASAALHTISPISKGLVHKVITESGTFKAVWSGFLPKGVAAQKTIDLANLVNCPTSSRNWTSIIACLRSITAVDLTAATLKFRQWDIYPVSHFLPVVEPAHDGAFLTSHPKSTPDSFSIPVMTGFNKDEGLFATFRLLQTPEMQKTTNDNLRDRLPIMMSYQYQPDNVQQSITKAIFDYYIKGGANFNLNNFQNFTDIITDAWMISPFADYIMERLSNKTAAPTYSYTLSNKGYVSYTDFSGGEQFYGTCHGDDLLSLFPQADSFQPSLEPATRDRKLSELMVDLWTNFATSGNPTPKGSNLPIWNPVTSYPPSLLQIGSLEDDGTLLQMTNTYPLDRVNFWQTLGAFKWQQRKK